MAVKRGELGGTTSSLSVNVLEWSKILKKDYREHRKRERVTTTTTVMMMTMTKMMMIAVEIGFRHMSFWKG